MTSTQNEEDIQATPETALVDPADEVTSQDEGPDGGYGWIVVFSGLMVNLIGGFADVYGVFYVDLLEYFGESKSATAWPGGLCIAIIMGAGPLASMICSRWSHRVACILGGIVGAVGFLASAFATNLYTLYFTFGIVAGFGFCLQYLSASIIVGYYFTKRRNLAMCICLSGVCMGDFIIAPLVEYLNEHYTWRGCMIVAAGFSLNSCVFGALMRPLPGISTRRDKPICDLSLLRKPVFLLFCLGEALWSIAFAVFLTISPELSHFAGFSKTQGSFVISVMGMASALSRIVIGLAANSGRCDRILIYSISVLATVAPLAALAYITEYWTLLLLAVLYGVGYGIQAGISPVILADIFGLENLTAAFGYLTLADGITCMAGPPIAGYLFDLTGNWAASCWFMALTTGIASIICFALKCSATGTHTEEKPLPLETT